MYCFDWPVIVGACGFCSWYCWYKLYQYNILYYMGKDYITIINVMCKNINNGERQNIYTKEEFIHFTWWSWIEIPIQLPNVHLNKFDKKFSICTLGYGTGN